MTDKTKNFKN